MTEEAATTGRNDNQEFEDSFNEFISNDISNDDEKNDVNDVNEEDENNDTDNDEESGDSVSELELLRKTADELRKERDYFEHSFKSQVGRVSALSKKINEVQAQVKDDQTSVDDEISVLMEDYPEIAGPLAKHYEKLYESKSVEQPNQEPAFTPEEQQWINYQTQVMDTDRPNWRATIASQDYASWLYQQPIGIQNMAASYASEDYKYLIDNFTKTTDNNKKANDITTRRNEKLAANVAISSQKQSRTTSPPDDFSSAWEYYASKKKA